MMMIKKKLLSTTGLASAIGVSLMLAVPSVALAVDFFSSDNPTYFGVGFGKNKYKFNGLKMDDSDTAKTIFVGKKYNQNLDIEAFYSDLGAFSQDLKSGATRFKAKIKMNQFGVRGIYKFSLDGDFEPYVMVGFAKTNPKLSYTNNVTSVVGVSVDSGTSALYALGVQKKYSSSVTLRAEYQIPEGDSKFMWAGISTTF